MEFNRVEEIGWSDVFTMKAPLKNATAIINALTSYFNNSTLGFYGNLVNPSLVKFNSSFITRKSRYTLNAVTDVAPLTNLNISGDNSVALKHSYGILNEGVPTVPLEAANNTTKDLVGVITFKKLSEMATQWGVRYATPLYRVVGWYNNGISIDSESAIKVVDDGAQPFNFYENVFEQYQDWVCPFFEFYELRGALPRTKVDEEDYIVPFVTITSNNLHWTTVQAIRKDNYYTSPYPIYLNIQAPIFYKSQIDYFWSYENTSTPFENMFFMLEPVLSQFRLIPIGKRLTPYVRLALYREQDKNSFTQSRTHNIPINQPTQGFKLVSKLLPNHGFVFFPSEAAAMEYYQDWGLTVTKSVEEAQQLPTDDFPTEGIKDPPVTEIPSYPDDTSDIIEINPPDYTASSFGQCKVYTPSNTEPLIKWFGTNTFWQDINRLFADPMGAVFGLRLYNFDIVAHDTAHTEIQTATTILNVSTNIPCYKILSGYNAIINGGSYQYTAYYGNFADYLNTSYDIFIPYVGIRRLNPSDVVNRRLQLKYAVDLMTGSATVFLTSDDKLIMTTSCNISVEIPIQTSNINDVNFQTLMGVLTGALNGGKTGFLTGAKTGNVAGAIGGAAGGAVIGGTLGGLDNYLNSIEYGYQGSVSGNNSYSIIEPFLIVKRFPIANVGEYEKLFGLVNATTTTFKNLGNGYIKADTVEINTRATSKERDEIIALLHDGIHTN